MASFSKWVTFLIAASLINGPICVSSMNPSPAFILSTSMANFSLKAAKILTWIKNRLVQTQVCPAFLYFESMAPFTAASISASAKTMNGAFPPSSSDNFFRVAAPFSIKYLPVLVEPVKDIF